VAVAGKLLQAFLETFALLHFGLRGILWFRQLRVEAVRIAELHRGAFGARGFGRLAVDPGGKVNGWWPEKRDETPKKKRWMGPNGSMAIIYHHLI